MPIQGATSTLLKQLGDPSRSSQALLALLMKGHDGVRALVEFLRSSKPSSLPEARLMAVEGLSIVKDPEALSALIDVAGEPLDEISDPVIRLAEQTVASRAARILGDFPNPRAREALLGLVKGKPLAGVAEAFERSWDLRAIPYLVSWLEEDFVAEAASRALRVCGRFAFSPLIDSLGEKHLQYEQETGMSQRRRARILEILDDLIRIDEVHLIESLLDDPVEAVQLNAARAVLDKGSRAQQRRAFEVALRLLDSSERNVRTLSEEILLEHPGVGHHLVEQEIQRRELAGESAQQFFPQESTLVILLRIRKKGRQLREARQ
jgi:HEAT repeat protein